MINIQGIQKTSLVDFEPNVAMTIFLGGCNFRCGFCHNPDIVFSKNAAISEDEVFDVIEKRKHLLDGVCITGGEPTLYDLRPLIEKIKRYDLKVKLDTNGTNPEIIKSLIENNMIDYVAMDIKAPLERYDEIAGAEVDIGKIKETIEILKVSSINYEFRTTALPLLDEEDFEKMGILLKGAKLFSIQQFFNENVLDKNYANMKPHDTEKLKKFAEIMKKYVKDVKIKNI